MARRWTTAEENSYRAELYQLYITKNKTIKETGIALGLAEQTVFKRLVRLGIPILPHLKPNYLRKKKNVVLPSRSECLAEFFGIMLGDGHISHFQTVVTLGTKELEYVEYVSRIMQCLFDTAASISVRADGYRDVYIGSVIITDWLKKEGLVSNKVAAQVGVPEWIFEKEVFMKNFVRGFFDTDGSVYKLKFGIQISFSNKSVPLLKAVHRMLVALKYRPSVVCGKSVYLTRRNDVGRFFEDIMPANNKHVRRFANIQKSVGTEVVKRDAL